MRDEIESAGLPFGMVDVQNKKNSSSRLLDLMKKNGFELGQEVPVEREYHEDEDYYWAAKDSFRAIPVLGWKDIKFVDPTTADGKVHLLHSP